MVSGTVGIHPGEQILVWLRIGRHQLERLLAVGEDVTQAMKHALKAAAFYPAAIPELR